MLDGRARAPGADAAASSCASPSWATRRGRRWSSCTAIRTARRSGPRSRRGSPTASTSCSTTSAATAGRRRREPLRGGFTLEKLTDDFLAVADAVSPDRPVHLVGHDWGSVQAWEFVTVPRTEGRIASFTSMSGPVPRPLRPLDQAAGDAGPPRAGSASCSARAPSPGTCTCCTPPCCPSWPGAARSASAGPRILRAGRRRCPPAATRPPRCRRTRRTAPGSTATTSAPGCAARAPTPTRTCPCSSSRRPGGRLPLGAALRRTGAVGAAAGPAHPAGQALGAAHPARPAGRLDHASSSTAIEGGGRRPAAGPRPTGTVRRPVRRAAGAGHRRGQRHRPGHRVRLRRGRRARGRRRPGRRGARPAPPSCPG